MLNFTKFVLISLFMQCFTVYAEGINHIPSKFHGAWSEHLEICKNPENDIHIEIKNSEYSIYEEECYLVRVEKVTLDTFSGKFDCLDEESNKTRKSVKFTIIDSNTLQIKNVFHGSTTLKSCKRKPS